MSIDIAWSAEDSALLDQLAQSTPTRVPLHPEPALWEAFAADRIQYAIQSARGRKGGRARRKLPVVPVSEGGCAGCGRPLRPNRSQAADYPGTVTEAIKGLCFACYRERRQEG